MSGDLLGSLQQWRERYGDMVHLRIWPEHQIIVANPTLVRELLLTHHDALVRWERGVAVFSQLHGHSVLTTEGDTWRRKRQALQPGFLPKPVHASVPVMAHAAAEAFARWPGSMASWPIESALTSLGMELILQTMFSSPIAADARMAEQAVRAASAAGNREMYWPLSLPDWLPWKREKRRSIAMLKRLIDRHVHARLAADRAGWPDDMLGKLLGLHRDDPDSWPLQAVRDECMTAFLAGHDTTAATLTWWVWNMASHPDAQARVRQEVDQVLAGRAPGAADLPALHYLAQTLQETLRRHPAAPVLLTRRATRPITLGGWQFPARTMFTIPMYLLHHDAQLFPEPQAFRPERFGADAPSLPRGAFMPFGAGPRVCLGQHLALAEMTVIAAMLLQRFELAVPPGMTAPAPQFNITLRPQAPLHLSLVARARRAPDAAGNVAVVTTPQ